MYCLVLTPTHPPRLSCPVPERSGRLPLWPLRGSCAAPPRLTVRPRRRLGPSRKRAKPKPAARHVGTARKPASEAWCRPCTSRGHVAPVRILWMQPLAAMKLTPCTHAQVTYACLNPGGRSLRLARGIPPAARSLACCCSREVCSESLVLGFASSCFLASSCCARAACIETLEARAPANGRLLPSSALVALAGPGAAASEAPKSCWPVASEPLKAYHSLLKGRKSPVASTPPCQICSLLKSGR